MFRRLVLISSVCLGLIACNDTRVDNSESVKNPIQGAWVISENKWNGEVFDLPEPHATKIYSAGTVMYTYYDAENDGQLSVGAGVYTYEDGNITETITNHSRKDLIGQKFSLRVELSEDLQTFKQSVAIDENTLDEVWTRLD
jgi:hypothetical protein